MTMYTHSLTTQMKSERCAAMQRQVRPRASYVNVNIIAI